MYCRADVHFIVFYLLAFRDAFSKVLNFLAELFVLMGTANCKTAE